MSEDASLIASPDLVAAWVAGWALSRGLAPPTPAYGGLRVEVGLPDQKARFVFADAGLGVRRASDDIREAHVFLKVCAAPGRVAPLLADGWRLGAPSSMMTLDGLDGLGSSVPDGYTLALDQTGGVVVATCTSKHGEPAAGGRLALCGATAVFDRIETDPHHRRIGLGRTVMTALSAHAHRCGAKVGALVATPDGRALYGAMGWRLHAPYTTAYRD